MSYLTNIPFTGETLGQSRPQVQTNFSLLQTTISVDHIAMNLAGAGEHSKITLHTFGSFPFTVSGTKSYISSYNASGAGTQLVYQPSIVNYNVPVSPRSLARVSFSAGSFLLGNGPYGVETNFNAGTPTTTNDFVFTYNFSNPLTDTNYFVFYASDGANVNIEVVNKTVNGFQVNLSAGITVNSILFMVY